MKLKKTFVIFAIFSLIAAYFMPLSNVNADSTSYWLYISTSEVIGFRNNPVEITVSSNASQVAVTILDPTQQQIYSQVWNGNVSREITIPAQAEYGTYTIQASVDGFLATTLFTVLDVTGWASAAFPYMRQHKGINYQFHANGTIFADNGEDVLEIDLSTLRTLINNLELDVNCIYNDMNFLVRLNKGVFALDLTFSFIHTGCKFTINGTIDQARSFTFKMANTSILRSLVDNLRVGHIVFNYCDLRKVAYAFSYDQVNRELTVNVPKTFWIDPTISEIGFEGGDTSEFTGTNGSPTVVEDPVYEGSYSMLVDTSHEYGYIDFEEQDELYVQTTICLNDTAAHWLRYFDILNSESGTIASVDFGPSIWSNQRKFRIWYLNESFVFTEFLYDAFGSNEDWYTIKLHATVNDGAGVVEVWLNDTELVSITDIDTDTYGNINRAIFGSDAYENARFYDSIIISDQDIGEEGESTFSLDVSTVDQEGNALTGTTFHLNGTAYENSTSLSGLADGSVYVGNATWQGIVVNSTFTITVSGNTTATIICNAWNFTYGGSTRHIAADRDVLTASWSENTMTMSFDSSSTSNTLVFDSGTRPTYITGLSYDLSTDWNGTSGVFSGSLVNTTYTVAVSFATWGDFYVQSVDDPILSLGWNDVTLVGLVDGTGDLTIYCGSRQAPEHTSGITVGYDATTSILTVSYNSSEWTIDWALGPETDLVSGEDDSSTATAFTVLTADFGSLKPNQTRTITISLEFSSSSIEVTDITFGSEWLQTNTALPASFTRGTEETGTGSLEVTLTIPEDAEIDDYTAQMQVIGLDPFGAQQTATGLLSWNVEGESFIPEEAKIYLVAAAVAVITVLAAAALLVRRKH